MRNRKIRNGWFESAHGTALLEACSTLYTPGTGREAMYRAYITPGYKGRYIQGGIPTT